MNYYFLKNFRLGLRQLQVFIALLLVILGCNSCIRIGSAPPVQTVTITFNNFLLNSFNSVRGGTYVSYHYTFDSWFYSTNAQPLHWDHKSGSVASSTSAPQFSIITNIPSNHTLYRFVCTVDATQCTTKADPLCFGAGDPDGTNGDKYGAESSWFFENNWVLCGSSSPGFTISNFIQQANVANTCLCRVPF